jgi:cation transport protein ChaC
MGPDRFFVVFGYASLDLASEFESADSVFLPLHGYHRALKMWSRVNRGIACPAGPGVWPAVGGSCRNGLSAAQGPCCPCPPCGREMPNGIYDPEWLRCRTAVGDIKALASRCPAAVPTTPAC